jgi:hypothetical protein
MRPLRILLLYATWAEARRFSYQIGWPAHFLRHPGIACTAVDVGDARVMRRLRAHLLARFARTDAVVLLHSVFSNALMMGERLMAALAALPQPKAYFIGNEYKLLPEKMAFCERLGVRLFVTMNPDPRAQALYRERLGCSVVSIPSAGLDLAMFRPGPSRERRPIDIGYRADPSPVYLGHDERTQLAEAFLCAAPRLGLRVDISTASGNRLPVQEWAAFLAQCRGQLGSEAGGDRFELTDATRIRVNAYMRAHPDAPTEEVLKRFFAKPLPQDAVPVRMISGRHVEAAATRTVQLLIEGRYSGYFEPDVHYVPLLRDLSNIDEAVEKFQDAAHCERLCDNAYDVVRAELTYERLIARFLRALRDAI